ncbi:glutathione binding-like protein [Gammaproteobacteria bacterium]|nr:glutathione binding-like protein [Gammaproteobacteria bacterium]
MIDLWGRSNAYNVQKPLWLLAELELEFRHHEIGSSAGDLETPEFLKLNPQARIPVLQHGAAVVWESNSILRYLANSFTSIALYPDEALLRSRVERWMDWELASLQPAFIDLFWGYYRTPPAARDPQAIDIAQRQCRGHFAALERQLTAQPYLAGDFFSLADIACGVCLFRYFNMGLGVEQPPHVMRWYQQLSQRKAFRHTIMQPFEELEGRTEF